MTNEMKMVELNPGVDGIKYEDALRGKIFETEAHIRSLDFSTNECRKAIDGWKPAPLIDATPKAATVHMSCQWKNRGSATGLCAKFGMSFRSMNTTENESEVTCTRCLKTMADHKAAKAAKEQSDADGQALINYLLANTKATSKVIKAHFGWDTKRFNQAVQKADGVSQDYNSKEYSITAYLVRIKLGLPV